MGETKLNFINRSKEGNHPNIVIYQPNEASMSYDEMPIAWKVIEKCGIDETQSFSFASTLEVLLDDTLGNYTAPVQALEGRILEIKPGTLGPQLELLDKMTYNPSEFGVLNALRDGSYHVHCFRNGRLLSTREYLYPGEKALFRFSDTIAISVIPEAKEREEIDTSLIGETEVQFDLTGIGSADIIMTGGEEDTPFTFSLENIEQEIFKHHQIMETPSWWDETGSAVQDQKNVDVPSWWNDVDTPLDKGTGSGGSQPFGTPSWWKETED
ncbi:MAG: hypothetical protein AB8B56_01455 [Crocinitomicaceae bacterium]